MSVVWQFVLVALAVYRISRMIAAERGPFDLFERLRSWAFDRFGKDSWQFGGISCALCLSFWLGWLGAALLPFTGVMDFVLTALALSGVASFLYKVERQ